MTRYKLPAFLGATMLALTAVAQAADMPQLPLPAMKAPVQEFFSPWYVRLDGGYRINEIKGGTQFGGSFRDSRLGNAPTIGGGVGLKWNWFRTDVTIDYGSQPKFEGFFVTGTPSVIAKLNNTTVLWNAYADLGTWWGMTPYLGLGVGSSYLKPVGFQTNPATLAAVQNQGKWNFSWAGTAGIGYAISPGLLVDANYRYLDIGSTSTNIPALGKIEYGDWTGHEFRLGLRYLIQ
jgi:opacity protein-like surface antigen